MNQIEKYRLNIRGPGRFKGPLYTNPFVEQKENSGRIFVIGLVESIFFSKREEDTDYRYRGL